ncbi:four helix bundle protein [Dehalococcoidia bacterium]|nr:four helix bundle protein [Dehalococcoidia bacterium]
MTRAVKLSVICYDMTKSFPREEQFGLVSQMRRAAISIASNIAEGVARAGNKEFIQFLITNYQSQKAVRLFIGEDARVEL